MDVLRPQRSFTPVTLPGDHSPWRLVFSMIFSSFTLAVAPKRRRDNKKAGSPKGNTGSNINIITSSLSVIRLKT